MVINPVLTLTSLRHHKVTLERTLEDLRSGRECGHLSASEIAQMIGGLEERLAAIDAQLHVKDPNDMRAAPLRDRLGPETLKRLYWQQGLTTSQIAERFGSSPSNVSILMEKYGIARRPRGGR